MADTAKLYEAIRTFSYNAKPSNPSYGDPCTVAELRKAVESVADLLNIFVQELEDSQNF